MLFALAAAGISLLGLFVLAVAGPLYRVGVPLATAFAILRWAAYIGLAGVVCGLSAFVWARWRGKRLGSALALVGVLVGAITVGVPYGWQRRAQSLPPIHDITTDLDNPPQFKDAIALRADAPNSLDRGPELATLQRDGYPDLMPLTVASAPGDAFTRALAVAQDLGWEIVSADQSGGRIEATDTTRWFGFTDDVVVRLTPWGTGTRVDVRSVSRVGRSDVGTNARRIEEFLERLQSAGSL
jgi:uncharacterized protein (DUF1499 family)